MTVVMMELAVEMYIIYIYIYIYIYIFLCNVLYYR